VGRTPTLQTIADELGVSRSTVSNAYNRPDQLTPELRERVLETARKLGYGGPNPAARRLRAGHAGVIGVVLTENLSYAFSDPAAVYFLEGLAGPCEEAGAGMLLLPIHVAAASAEAVRDAVVDGLCIYSLPDEHPAVQAAIDRGIPTVIVDEPVVRGTGFVGIDDRGATRMLGEHLTALGHRDVGILVPTIFPGGYEGPSTEARLDANAYHMDRQRLRGLRDALTAVGVGWKDVPVQESANQRGAGAVAARALLERDPRPTAVAALTDQLALGVLDAARELGLRVPEDLSVTGFDDIVEAARSDPPLTTVRQPLGEKGDVAGRVLLDLIAGKRVRKRTLPVELKVRASTGPPSAAR
jgi:DNA-binding LacI/PurR family transcriptional regulator